MAGTQHSAGMCSNAAAGPSNPAEAVQSILQRVLGSGFDGVGELFTISRDSSGVENLTAADVAENHVMLQAFIDDFGTTVPPVEEMSKGIRLYDQHHD